MASMQVSSKANISLASVVLGTERPVAEGRTGTLYCVIRLESGELRHAYLTRGAAPIILAEASAAIILREWGLPVPDAFLVPYGDEFCFASADAGMPNLKQPLGLIGEPRNAFEEALMLECARAVFDIPTTALAAACDEAIGNRDRNIGNILWDGTKEAWIDHGFSFLGGQGLADKNKLCDIAALFGRQQEMLEKAAKRALGLDGSKVSQIKAGLVRFKIDTSAEQEYLYERLKNVAQRIIARFQPPDDLLQKVGVAANDD